ncbi:unnamed protein product, partial [Gadus morhua 'NCC']
RPLSQVKVRTESSFTGATVVLHMHTGADISVLFPVLLPWKAHIVTHSNEEEAGCFTAAWTCGSDLVLHPFRSEEYLTAGVGHHGKIQNRVWFGGTSPKMADMYTSHKHKQSVLSPEVPARRHGPLFAVSECRGLSEGPRGQLSRGATCGLGFQGLGTPPDHQSRWLVEGGVEVARNSEAERMAPASAGFEQSAWRLRGHRASPFENLKHHSCSSTRGTGHEELSFISATSTTSTTSPTTTNTTTSPFTFISTTTTTTITTTFNHFNYTNFTSTNITITTFISTNTNFTSTNTTITTTTTISTTASTTTTTSTTITTTNIISTNTNFTSTYTTITTTTFISTPTPTTTTTTITTIFTHFTSTNFSSTNFPTTTILSTNTTTIVMFFMQRKGQKWLRMGSVALWKPEGCRFNP